MKLPGLFIFSCLLLGCNRNQINGPGNLIDLSGAIINKQEIKLSALADSISFIILETDTGNLIGNNPEFTFSEQYLFSHTFCFDWNGKFLRRIGKIGRGPGEDTFFSYLLYKNNCFYTKGRKFIEYDSAGVYTGKEKSFYTGGLTDDAKGELTNVADFINTKNYFAVYDYPDSIFFLDIDFNILAGKKVLDYSPDHWINPVGPNSVKYFSSFRDTVLFYNFFNDTVYKIENCTLTPRWIVKIDDQIKAPDDYLIKNEQLSAQAANAWLKGDVSESELIRITDGKNMILKVYETDSFLIFIAREIRLYSQFRNIERPEPYIIVYNKHSKYTAATQGPGFIDDLSGSGYFMPNQGIYNNKMISSIFPHQLHERIKNAQKSGKEINPVLMNLIQKMKTDDNPILIVVHLKPQGKNF